MKKNFFRSLIFVLFIMLLIVGRTPGMMASAANDNDTGSSDTDSGDSDSGDSDSGDSDSGDSDSGDSDSGDSDSGDSDSGDSDSGDSDSGDSDSGDSDSGDSDSGDSDSGDSDSGDSNSGDDDSGDDDDDNSDLAKEASVEPASNVAVKELATRHVISGYPIRFDFVENVTCVTYIGFDPKKTFRKTTTVVEELKGNSTLVPTLPPGKVYKYMNIWVGEKGAGLPTSLKNGYVQFKVQKAWIEKNNISDSLITLQWYDKEWKPLYTEKVGEDENYIYFKSKVTGFSFFAITEYADGKAQLEGKVHNTLINLKSEGELVLGGNAGKSSIIKNPEGKAKALLVISLPMFMIGVGYAIWKKKI
jgi:PGF-pre-PGF domain-containing protein